MTIKINPTWSLRLSWAVDVDLLYTSAVVLYKYGASDMCRRKLNNYYIDFPNTLQSWCSGIEELGSPVSGMWYKRTICGQNTEF